MPYGDLNLGQHCLRQYQIQNSSDIGRLDLKLIKKWCSDTICWHRSGSTSAQEMASCLTTPSNYLCQCWFLIKGAVWHSPESNLPRNAHEIYLYYHVFKASAFKITHGSRYTFVVEVPGSPPFEFPRAPSNIWRVPPLEYITNSPILGGPLGPQAKFHKGPFVIFRGPGPLPLGPREPCYHHISQPISWRRPIS